MNPKLSYSLSVLSLSCLAPAPLPDTIRSFSSYTHESRYAYRNLIYIPRSRRRSAELQLGRTSSLMTVDDRGTADDDDDHDEFDVPLLLSPVPGFLVNRHTEVRPSYTLSFHT